jgi:hypothetical protein
VVESRTQSITIRVFNTLPLRSNNNADEDSYDIDVEAITSGNN